jgi:DNA mismatch repair protein MutS
MIPLFHFLSEIDTLQSIYTLYENEKYQLAEWVTISENPIITIKKMWHPYFSQKNYVSNSIQMKKENIRLITGPNAGGKSTFIKSLMTSILFSQTLTIVPCKKFVVTPFTYLYTYLHIPDVKGKHSLFQAEMERNKIFLQHLERCDKSQNTFMIVDELFSSTNYDEGVSAAYSILKKITEYKNQKTIVTTHFTELTKLEKEMKKRVKNYYFTVDIKEGEDGKKQVKYNYQLKRGINKKKIALQLLQENSFSEDIMKDAINFFEKLEKK